MAEIQKDIGGLFDRDDEIKLLEELLVKAENGKPCLAFISGSSGVGKTALVKNAMNPLNHGKDIYIYSKFDEHDPSSPYHPFTQLIRELIRYLLAVPKDKIGINKKRIKKAVGNSIEVLSGLIPELKYIFDKKTNMENINLRDQRTCIECAYYQIMKEFATKDSPIVIFIDDLQWADELSLDLLKYFCCNFYNEHLFLICAFRNYPKINMLCEKVESIDNKTFGLEYIPLSNFTFQQTSDFVFHYFSIAGNTDRGIEINKTAKVLYKKTLGNPSCINQVKAYFEKGENQKGIDNIIIPDDVVQIIVDKIVNLPEKTKTALIFASIIGNVFSLDILSQALCSTNEDVLSLLNPALTANLIIPSDSYNEFEFVHDRIRKELIRMADDPERVHLIVGRELLRYYKSDLNSNRLIEIMHHFIVSAELIDDENEKIELAGYFAAAGGSLLQTSAYADAVQYYKMALKFIEEEPSNIQDGLKYSSYLGYAHALFLEEKYPQAEEAFKAAFTYARTKMDGIKVLQCKTTLYFLIGDHEAVITTGIDALARMGVHIPVNPSKIRISFEAIKAAWLFRSSRVDGTLDNRENCSAETETLLNLFVSIAFSAVTVNQRLFLVLILRFAILSIRRGNTKYASLGYTGYGFIAGCFYDDFVKAGKLRCISQRLMNKNEKNDKSDLSSFANALLLNYWLDDWHSNLTYFDEVYNSGIENGCFYAASALSMKIIFLFSTGRKLDDLITESLKDYEQVNQLKAKEIALSLLMMAKVFKAIKQLRVETIDDEILTRKIQDKDNLFLLLVKMQIYYMNGKYEEAVKLTLESSKQEYMITGFCLSTDYVFYQSLIITGSGNWKKIKYRKILYKNLNKLQKWFTNCPANFAQKYYLVSAEIARTKGKTNKAADLYEKAVLSAAENGFTQDEAIASELAGKFFYSVESRQRAETCVLNAYHKYKQWGADGKVSLMEQEYPFLIAKKEEDNIQISKQEENDWNDKIVEALKIAMQEKDPHRLLEHLMDIVLEIGAADRGCLLFERNDDLHILLVRNKRYFLSEFNNIVLSECRDLPQKLIYYAYNICEPVILKWNQEKGAFLNDPYINKNPMQSQLVIPLIFHGVSLGILYLEKNSDSKECSAECVEIIKALSCQTMILKRLQLCTNDEEENSTTNNIPLIEGLTPKEIEILGHIASGNSNKEIADALGVSINTVKTHVLSIYSKLNVKRRSQATIKARDLNLKGSTPDTQKMDNTV